MDWATRFVFVAAVISAFACTQATAQDAGALMPPSLKAAVTVTGEIVRIGDLVEHAGVAANVAVFRAPDLGQTGTVPAARVIEALRSHDVIGIETHGLNEVAVTRASRAITPEHIESRIVRALAGKHGFGEARDITVTLDGEARSLHVEAVATSDPEIARLSFDRRTRRFDVVFEIPGSAVAKKYPLRFTGSAADTAETAVIVRPLARGDVVRAADIAIEKRPRAEVSSDVLRGPQAIIGLAAKRALTAGQIVRSSDLMKPEYVVRNETVTIVYQVPGVLLTLRGKALESGTEGDIVSVLNVQSKRTIQGIVTAPGRVTVAGLKPQLAANISANPSKLESAAR
ncbi:MAG: flagellar basal body P-ring formation protein FlgA [Rhizobiales bacterium]|nr:flagellar basal body P-ring formation protein FlgA [Hyphomicrobiales bacterium]